MSNCREFIPGFAGNKDKCISCGNHKDNHKKEQIWDKAEKTIPVSKVQELIDEYEGYTPTRYGMTDILTKLKNLINE